jgi:hypothetical protein
MAQAAAPNSSIARRSFCSFIEFFPLGRILRAGPGHFFINVMSVCPHQPASAGRDAHHERHSSQALRGHHHTAFLIPDLRTALPVTRDEVTADG